MLKKWKSFNESINNEGICICKIAPMGSNGLEGFEENEEYKYELRDLNGRKYYRVYHKDGYYETCGIKTFNKFFNARFA